MIQIKEKTIGLLEEQSVEIKRGRDVLLKAKIKQVESAIPTAYEQSKTNELLKPLIQSLDFQSLKKIDAVMRRHREVTTDKNETDSYITSKDLSESAINLYVALVKETYLRTVSRCKSIYSTRELDQVGYGLKEFNLGLNLSNGDKDKRFIVAEQAMSTLKTINSSVVSNLSSQLNKNKQLAK